MDKSGELSKVEFAELHNSNEDDDLVDEDEDNLDDDDEDLDFNGEEDKDEK